MLRSSLLVLLTLVCTSAAAQRLQDFTYLGDPYGDELYINLVLKRTAVKNPGAPREEVHDISAITGDFQLKRVSFEAGGFRYSMQYKLISDLIFIIDDQVNDDGSAFYRSESSSLTSGVIGWHNFGWNFVATDKLSAAIGFNLNDYFIGTSYRELDSLGVAGELVTNEPQGWYIASGPALFADLLISKYTLLHIESAYGIPLSRPINIDYAVVDDEYPFPHFMHFSAELVSPWGVFIGGDYSHLINRGDLHNNTRRLDLMLGFKFVL